MNNGPHIIIQVNRHFEVSAERVFDAWLDPHSACKWLFATPTGQMVRAEIDARVGGSYLLVDRRDGEDVEHFGEYLEIDRPRRLVFTFSVEKHSRDTDHVIIEVAPLENGCKLTLTHEMLAKWAEYASRTEQGWADILAGLASTLE